MSKEFQRVKERNDVRQHLMDFVGSSISRAVSKKCYSYKLC